eukprot:g429.t1
MISNQKWLASWSGSGGQLMIGAMERVRWFRASHSIQEGSTIIVVPSMGDSITEGTIATLLKKQGDTLIEDDVVAQIETDKVTIDVRYTGSVPAKITELLVKEQDTVTVGQAVVKVEEIEGEQTSEAGKEAEEESPKPKVLEKSPKPKVPETPPGPKALVEDQTEPPKAQLRPENRVPMSRLRQRVAQRLKGAQNTYALLTTFNEVDMSNIMEMRTLYKEMFLQKHGVKLGFMSAFVKASVTALMDLPAVNAVIEDDEIVYREYIDISLAVATPKGLVVPVLRDAHRMTFADVEKRIGELGARARDGTISIDEMSGGTFTISNGGVYGSMLSTPIINPPQSAILGMHAIQQRPIVKGKEIIPKPMMYIALTYDHRLIDGREVMINLLLYYSLL